MAENDVEVSNGLKKLAEELPAKSSNPFDYDGPNAPFFAKRAVTLVKESRRYHNPSMKSQQLQEAKDMFASARAMLLQDIEKVEAAQRLEAMQNEDETEECTPRMSY